MIHWLPERIAQRRSAMTAWHWLLTALVSAGVLAACAEIDQRAVPPGIVRREPAVFEWAGTATPVSQTAERQPATGPILPEPRRVYFTHGGNLWQLPVDNLSAPVVVGHDILAFAPSPDGEQIAVVVQSRAADGSPTDEFQIVNADSTVALRVPIPATLSGESPRARGVSSVAWSPDGQSIAFARQDGSISVIGLDGSVRLLVPRRPDSRPGRLMWASDAQALAYLDPALPEQPTSLHTVSIATGEIEEVVSGTAKEDAVLGATWLPGQTSLAYIRSSVATVDRGGDVFQIDPATRKSRLLASAGQFAPVSGAVDLAASPNGRYLAFSIFTPGESKPLFQSLWVMDLASRGLTEVPTARGEAVTDLWWAAGQLIFRTIDESQATLTGVYTGTEPFTLYQFDPATGASTARYRHPGA